MTIETVSAKEIEICLDAIEAVKEKASALPTAWFMATICMMLEEYCKERKLDIKKQAEYIWQSINNVNSALGKY